MIRLLGEKQAFFRAVYPGLLSHTERQISAGLRNILTSLVGFARYGIFSSTRSASSPLSVKMNLASMVLSALHHSKGCQRIRPDVP